MHNIFLLLNKCLWMLTWGQTMAIKGNFGYRKLHVYNSIKTRANRPDTCNDPGNQFIKHRYICIYVHINSMCKKLIRKEIICLKSKFSFLIFKHFAAKSKNAFKNAYTNFDYF